MQSGIMLSVLVSDAFSAANRLIPGSRGRLSPKTLSPGGRGMLARVKSFLADQNGATAIEYALIAAGIAAAIITTVQSLGTKVTALFSDVNSAMN
jgi:pilus assembly protein Flp/PilA